MFHFSAGSRLASLFTIVGVASFAGVAAVVASGAAGQDSRQTLHSAFTPGKPRPPIVQFAGHDSKVASERFVLVKDENAWEVLWSEHSGRPVPQGPPTRHQTPKVDFARCMVVGHFTGPTTNQDGEVCESIDTAGGELRIRFRSSSFQTASFNGPDRGVSASAFGLWVIDRADLPIVIEEGVIQSLQDTTVRWIEVKRFD